MRIPTLVVFAALLACASTKHEEPEPEVPEEPPDTTVTTPSGHRGFVVSCTEAVGCLRDAAAGCKGGAYELRDMGAAGTTTSTQSKGATVAVPVGESAVAVGRGTSETSQAVRREFLVECKSAAARGEPPKMLGPCSDGASPPTPEELAACETQGGKCVHVGAGLFQCAVASE